MPWYYPTSQRFGDLNFKRGGTLHKGNRVRYRNQKTTWNWNSYEHRSMQQLCESRVHCIGRQDH